MKYSEIIIGQTAEYNHQIKDNDIRLFASATGDHNPLNTDLTYARGTMFGGLTVHSSLVGAIAVSAITTKLPGPGTIILRLIFNFKEPVRINDTLKVNLKVIGKLDNKKQLAIEIIVRNQFFHAVLTGEALVMMSK